MYFDLGGASLIFVAPFTDFSKLLDIVKADQAVQLGRTGIVGGVRATLVGANV
jgi:hypothetical protein